MVLLFSFWKRKCSGTHIGVFGHGVELEEEGALDNLTHLTQGEGNTGKYTLNGEFNSLILLKQTKNKSLTNNKIKSPT